MAEAVREMLADEGDAREYLRTSFLFSAMLTLFHARRAAGLTQAQVAERLHTKQSAIARMEADQSGSTSLRRYVEYALACGVVPLDIALEPVGSVREYALADPEAPRTPRAYDAWRAAQHDGKPAAHEATFAIPTSMAEPLLRGILEMIEENKKDVSSELLKVLQQLPPNLEDLHVPELIWRRLLDKAKAIRANDNDVRDRREEILEELARRLPEPLRAEAKQAAHEALWGDIRAIVSAERAHDGC